MKVIKYLSIAFLILIAALSYLALQFPFPEEALKQVLNQPKALVIDHKGDIMRMKIDHQDQLSFPIEHNSISQTLIDATIAAEDHRFYEHSGVDIWAMSRALWQNVSNARRISGASTISMQVVKLLHNKPRTYRQKMIEIYHALLLEQRLSKQDIIELYLNLAPYGGNMVGCEAASRLYFNKACKDLTKAEACLIAGLPQSPSRFYLFKYMDRALVRRDYVLDRMLSLDLITLDEKRKIINQDILLTPTKPVFNKYVVNDQPKPRLKSKFVHFAKL